MIRTALDPEGIAFVRDLRAAGATARDVARAVESGELQRLRSGLVADARASEEVRRAARVGGRLAGVSAARHHGLWVPSAHLTVAVPEHSGGSGIRISPAIRSERARCDCSAENPRDRDSGSAT